MSILPLLALAGGAFWLTRRDGEVVQRNVVGPGALSTGPAKQSDAAKPLAERFKEDLASYQEALKGDKASVAAEQVEAIKQAFEGPDDRERAYALKALGNQASSMEIFSKPESRKAAAALAVDFQDRFEELGKRGALAKKLLEAVVALNAIPFTEPDKRLDAYGPIEKALVDLIVDIPEVGRVDEGEALTSATEVVSFDDGKQAVFNVGPKDVLVSLARKIDDKVYQGHIGKLVEAKSFSPAGKYAVVFIAPKAVG